MPVGALLPPPLAHSTLSLDRTIVRTTSLIQIFTESLFLSVIECSEDQSTESLSSGNLLRSLFYLLLNISSPYMNCFSTASEIGCDIIVLRKIISSLPEPPTAQSSANYGCFLFIQHVLIKYAEVGTYQVKFLKHNFMNVSYFIINLKNVFVVADM